MKGRIKSNLGHSRYIVALSTSNVLVTGQIDSLKRQKDNAIAQINALASAEDSAKSAFEIALARQQAAVTSYQSALAVYGQEEALADEELQCRTVRDACRQKCFDSMDFTPECPEKCDAAYTIAIAEAPMRAIDRLTKYQQKTHGTWAPIIEAEQKETQTKLTAYSKLAIPLSQEKARLLGIEIELETFEAIEAKETNITCYSAQYDDSLSTDTVVEVARSPEGRHAITAIKTVTNCLSDARTLPPRYLFVDAAFAPGRETWEPTWRTGTVKAINDDNTLSIAFDTSILYGDLGTPDSRHEINCVPPLAYFSDEWRSVETAIQAAIQALKDAQTAYAQALSDLAGCKKAFDKTALYNEKKANCETIWTDWLTECNQLADPSACQAQYEAHLNACLANAMAEAEDARRLAESLCDTQHAGAIAEAQAALETATEDLIRARSMHLAPAANLVRDVQIGHCVKSSYGVGDQVLIDFPVRTHSKEDPAAVWKSARVIGWVDSPQPCTTGLLIQSGADDYSVSCARAVAQVAVSPPTALFGTCYWHGRVNGEAAALSWTGGGTQLWLSVAAPITVEAPILGAAKAQAHSIDYVVYASVIDGTVSLTARALSPDPISGVIPGETVFATGPAPVVREGCVLQFSESSAKLAYSIPPLADWVGPEWPQVRLGPEVNGCVWECTVPPVPAPPPVPLPEGYTPPAPAALAWTRITAEATWPPECDPFYCRHPEVPVGVLENEDGIAHGMSFWANGATDYIQNFNEPLVGVDWQIAYTVVQGVYYVGELLIPVTFDARYAFKFTYDRRAIDDFITTTAGANPIGFYQCEDCRYNPAYGAKTDGWVFVQDGGYVPGIGDTGNWICQGAKWIELEGGGIAPIERSQYTHYSDSQTLEQTFTISYPDADPIQVFHDLMVITRARHWAGTWEDGPPGYNGHFVDAINTSVHEWTWTTTRTQASIPAPATGGRKSALVVGPSGTRRLGGRDRCYMDDHEPWLWNEQYQQWFNVQIPVVDAPVYTEDLAVRFSVNKKAVTDTAAFEHAGWTLGHIPDQGVMSWARPLFLTHYPIGQPNPSGWVEYWLGPNTCAPLVYLYRIPSDIYPGFFPDVRAPQFESWGVLRARTDDDPPYRIVEGKLAGHITALLSAGNLAHAVDFPCPAVYAEVAGANYLATDAGMVGAKTSNHPEQINMQYTAAGGATHTVTLVVGAVPAMVPYPGILPAGG